MKLFKENRQVVKPTDGFSWLLSWFVFSGVNEAQEQQSDGGKRASEIFFVAIKLTVGVLTR